MSDTSKPAAAISACPVCEGSGRANPAGQPDGMWTMADLIAAQRITTSALPSVADELSDEESRRFHEVMASGEAQIKMKRDYRRGIMDAVRLLDEEARQCQLRINALLRTKEAHGQTDGWRNEYSFWASMLDATNSYIDKIRDLVPAV